MPLYIMKRTCRSVDASSSTASTKETWLQTKSAPPFSGMLSRPRTRMRYSECVAHQSTNRSSESGSSQTTVNGARQRQHRADQENLSVATVAA